MSDVKTRIQAFKKLLAGRPDYFIDCECGYFLTESAEYRRSGDYQLLGFIEIYAAFSNSEKGKALKELWDKNLLQIQSHIINFYH